MTPIQRQPAEAKLRQSVVHAVIDVPFPVRLDERLLRRYRAAVFTAIHRGIDNAEERLALRLLEGQRRQGGCVLVGDEAEARAYAAWLLGNGE